MIHQEGVHDLPACLPMHVNPRRPHPLEHVLDELPMVLKRWIVVNRLTQCLAINGRSFGEILHHVHLDDVVIENTLRSTLSTRTVGVLKPCSTKPVPEFPEMPLVSFFPQEVAFLERKQVGELSDVPCRRVRGETPTRQMDVHGLVLRPLAVHRIDAEQKHARRVRLPRLDAPNVRVGRDVHQGPCPSCGKTSIEACNIRSMIPCQDTNCALGKHEPHAALTPSGQSTRIRVLPRVFGVWVVSRSIHTMEPAG